MKAVVAYGNRLRGDDAAAWHAAGLLQDLLPDVQFILEHQLMPEMAECIAALDEVIFVDTRVGKNAGAISIVRIKPDFSGESFTHVSGPGQLLGIAASLYGRCPGATLITVTGSNFEFQEGLSRAVLESIPLLAEHIRSALRCEHHGA